MSHPEPIEWDGTLGSLVTLPHGAPLLRRGRLLAANRDASWLNRPNVHSIKARHIAVVSHEAQIGGGAASVAAACDSRRIVLVEDLARDATTVHPNGRCRRPACRDLFLSALRTLDQDGATDSQGGVS